MSTVTAALSRAAARFGPRVFLDFTGELHTYSEIHEASNRLARGLVALGIRRGDTVATILDNNLHAVLAMVCHQQGRSHQRPVNTAYKGEFLQVIS